MEQKDLLKEKFDQIMVLYRNNKAMEAIDQVQELLTMANELRDHYYCATSYNFLGVLYTALGNVSRGIDYYFEAMIYAEKNQVDEVLAPVYNNIGSHYLDSGAFQSALEYLKKAEAKSGEIIENGHVGLDIQIQRKIINSANIALAYTNLKQYELSDQYIAKAQALMPNRNAEGIGFACAFLKCQNQYYLGNIEYVKSNLDFLINGIEELVSLYSYEQNITEMFDFLIEIDKQDKIEWLLQIVESFACNRKESHYTMLALKLRAKYEKIYGSKETYQETCEKLVEIYEEKEKETLHERELYMNLRMEMKRAEDERDEAQKRLAEMIQTVINQEYEYIAYIDTEKNTFSIHLARKLAQMISLPAYSCYEDMLANFIMQKVEESDQETLIKQLQISYVKEQLQQAEDYSIILKRQDQNENITYKKLLFTYIDKNRGILLLAEMDITELIQEERKQKKLLTDALKEAENANVAKSEFLSRMSHEIRTPLNAVIGYINMAQNNISDEDKLVNYHGKAQIAAKHLLSIINDVLDLSAIASGHFKIEYAPFDFKQIINDINAMFMQQALAKEIDFAIDMKPLEQEMLIGDSMRVKQILLNLLSNAMKFTPANGRITLRFEQTVDTQEDTKKILMQFDVQDTGIGMTKEFMDKIFTPFEQQDASISRKYGGTGLGLSISKQLTEMMGGIMKVESEENVGTTFIVKIPFGIAQVDAVEEKIYFDFSKVRTLLVDASEESANYNKTLLKRLKIKVDEVTNVEEAIHKLTVRQGGTYSYHMCIISDQRGEVDSLELVTQIRQQFDQKMLIMVLTQSGATENIEQIRKVGADAIVEKPLFQSVLFDFLMNKYAKHQDKKSKTAAAVNFNGLHVLLAEDNEMNMEIAEDILTRVNLLVDKAVNGKQAYEKFTQAPKGTYQAILMDVQMPEMDGYEATKAIRKSDHPEAKTMPIIALTANAFTEDIHKALESGMNGHIAKPINTRELFEMLGKVMS